MELYVKKISDITYMSELIPHLFSIQVFRFKSVNNLKGAGLNRDTLPIGLLSVPIYIYKFQALYYNVA